MIFQRVVEMFTILTLLNIRPSRPLNLDPRSPTIVRSGLSDSGANFGWALTQHSTNGSKIVLVSAPRANGTVREEGAIYSCPFDNRQTCTVSSVFWSKNNRYSQSFVDDLSQQISLEGQLLGYSLRSFGAKVVACAPLHKQAFGPEVTVDGVNYIPSQSNGRCVVVDGNLDPSTVIQIYQDQLSYTQLRVAGTDSGFVNVNGEARLIFNSIFGRFLSDSGSGKIIASHTADNMVNSRKLAESIILNSIGQEYTGYHIETGHFTTVGANTQIAVSAPRALVHRGKVNIMAVAGTNIQTLVTIRGVEVDGYFGYDFAVLSLGQEEGYQSLVVGCPLCGKDSGSVYVYVHTGNPNQPFTDDPAQVINPPSLSRGRFGIGVEAIGDIDLDGFTDVAISAPYQDSGVVFIYRGSLSGLVTMDYQTLTAASATTAFGYSMSGGLDIDDNGYPDLTIGELGGKNVISFRGSPLVNVTAVIDDAKSILNITGGSDRLCSYNGVLLHCFNITPCFYYEIRHGDVPRFALSYTLSVDITKSRLGKFEGGVVTATNEVMRVVTVSGPGIDNIFCDRTITFALYKNLIDPSPIPISILVDNAPDPVALEMNPDLVQFGDPLHPTLMKYERGDTPSKTRFDYLIDPNLDCQYGNPDLCEGSYTIDSIINFSGSDLVNERLILAPNNEFGFDLNVTNIAMDTAISSILLIRIPEQVRLSDTNLDCNSRTDNVTVIECFLKDTILSNQKLVTQVFFTFNNTIAILGMEEVEIIFSVRDGGTGNVSSEHRLMVPLDAIASYILADSLGQMEYTGYRNVIYFSDPSSLALDNIGPLVTYTILVQNSLDSSTGTPFPRSTLYIHFPTDVVKEIDIPLLVPTSIAVTTGVDNVNCSHFEAISKSLPIHQKPVNFIPTWTGARPPNSLECEADGKFRCGVIICNIFNLKPLPEPPSQISLFARLYSPSVEVSKEVGIYSTIIKDTELPRLSGESINSASSRFSLAAGFREVPRECIRYWVVVVSVVIGIFCVLIFILIIVMCAVFRRWYKDSQNDQLHGHEQTDSEYSYHRRTIPPIPGLNNGMSTAPENQPYPPVELKEVDYISERESEKEEEEEDEDLKHDLGEMFSSEAKEKRYFKAPPPPSSKIMLPPDNSMTSLGLQDEDYGIETDI